MKGRRFALVLFGFVLVLFAGIAAASDTGETVGKDVIYNWGEREQNPLYPRESANFCEAPVAFSEDNTVPVPSVFRRTLDEAAADLREGMKARTHSIAVGYVTLFPVDGDDLAHTLFYMAVAHTGKPDEGDYLTWQWKDRTINYAEYEENGVWYYTAYYVINYYTTPEMEEELACEEAKVLDELGLYEASDYEKIKGIYDYICANVTFDRTHAGQTSFTEKYTAYAALIHKKSVCQGIATLFYRFACRLGADCRVVFGLGGSTNHTWLIVRLGDTYFYLDPTWDLGKEAYSCFLMGEGDFYSHRRVDNPMCGLYYTSPAFYAAYPMAKAAFSLDSNPMQTVSGQLGDALYWKLGVDCRLLIGGTGAVPDYDTAEEPWKPYAPCVREIVIDRGVSYIGAGAFADCTEVASVSLPDPSVILGSNAFSPLTKVTYAGAGTIPFKEEMPYRLVESYDGTRCLIASRSDMDVMSLVEAIVYETADRFQIVSADGAVRYTCLDAVDFGARVQLLDGNGGVADEVTVTQKGDMNLDGAVTEEDAELLLWSFVSPEEFGYVPHYDLNGDGLTNASDAAALAMILSIN